MLNDRFQEAGAQVLGISCDPAPTQRAFAAALGGVPYPLLSDFYPHGQVAKLYGVFDEKRGTARRAVVVVDREGAVRFRKTYGSMGELDLEEVLEAVKGL